VLISKINFCPRVLRLSVLFLMKGKAADCQILLRMIWVNCRQLLPISSSAFLEIHKPNNPGRPIVSACSCPTEPISSYLDKIMAPIVRSLPSYVKDSQHALQIVFSCDFRSEETCNFFNKSGYPASVVQACHHRVQQIDRQSAPQTSQRENNDRIPFTLTTTQ